MPWVKIDEAMTEHSKLAGLSDRAFRAEFEALCFANRNLTDGLITTGQAKRWRRATAELVNARLWDEDPEGFRIHDYLVYNPSREQVLAQRAEAHASKVAGGKKRAEDAPREGGRFTSSDTSRPPAEPPAENQQPTSPVPVPVPVPPQTPNPTDLDTHKRARASKPAEPKRVTEVTPEFRERMVVKYADRASSELVNELIDESLGHASAAKWPDKQLHVQGWLRRTDWARETGRERTSRGAGPIVSYSDGDGAEVNARNAAREQRRVELAEFLAQPVNGALP